MPPEEEKLNISPDKFPVERYEILEELGVGSAGVVYLCRDKTLGKKVAVKILHELNADQLVDFQKEAKATALLDHPNIVKILDFGATASGTPYMVMDFIPGTSLEKHLKENGALDAELANAVFSQLADALIYAHGKKVYHRDLKPSNIILYETDSGIGVNLIDFGIARVKEVTGSVTMYQKRTLAGTPNYMSPDIVLGESFDARSEIYSLGCVMFEALLGYPPFSGESALEILSKHASEELPDLDLLFQDYPEFKPIIEKCLAKNKDDRYDSMQELKEALFQTHGFEYSVEVDIPETMDRPKTRLKILPMAILVLFILVIGFVFNSIVFMGKHSSAPELKTEVSTISAPEIKIVADVQANTVRVKRGKYRISRLPRYTTTNLDVLFGDKNVNDLTFEDCDLTNHKLLELKDFSIDSVELSICTLDKNTFEDLTSIKDVRQLNLVGFNLDRHLKPLEKMSLSVVALKGCSLTRNTMDDLNKIKGLNFLRLTDCSITKKNLLELGKFQRLTVLYLTGFEVDGSLAKTIGSISGLQELFFSECQLNDRNMFKELSQLKRLNSLDLRKSSLADLDQSQLKQIRSLKILRTTELSDELAKSLKASSIENFQIDRNPFVTNQDILKLSQAPRLKSIQVMECPKVSDVVVELFKQRNSKCQVKISNSFSSLVN